MSDTLFKRLVIIKTKIRYVFRSLWFLIGHLRHFRYFIRWIKSFKKGRNALTDEVPWLTYQAIEWLENFLTNKMTVFEYGSGGSTIFFAKRTGKTVSVEHDREWFLVVEQKLREKGLNNTELVLKEPKNIDVDIQPGGEQYLSEEQHYKNFSFTDYVMSIDQYPDEYFDMVLVDGRSRTECVKKALRKIKKSGFLMLDNSERARYQEVFQILKNFKHIHFYGLGNYNLYPWQTSIWQIQ